MLGGGHDFLYLIIRFNSSHFIIYSCFKPSMLLPVSWKLKALFFIVLFSVKNSLLSAI